MLSIDRFDLILKLIFSKIERSQAHINFTQIFRFSHNFVENLKIESSTENINWHNIKTPFSKNTNLRNSDVNCNATN